jgi:hypothetical protein
MPSLSTNGLLQFIPNGFDYSRSLSNSTPGVNGLETFLMNPLFNGFAGDMVTMNVHISVDSKTYRLQPWGPVNGIMPMPFFAVDPNYPGPTPVPTPIPILSCNSIGIAVSFKWYPASGNGNDFIEDRVFAGGTPLYPGTSVEVTVLTDPFGTYTVQSNTPVSMGGIKPMNTGVSSWYVGSPTFKTYTLNAENGDDYDIPFTDGQLTGPNRGSRQYIFNSEYNNFVTGSTDPVPMPVDPQQPGNFLSIGFTKGIQGNKMTQPGGQIYPYTYFDGIMKNAVWNYTAPLPIPAP